MCTTHRQPETQLKRARQLNQKKRDNQFGNIITKSHPILAFTPPN